MLFVSNMDTLEKGVGFVWVLYLIEMVKSKWALNMAPSPRHRGFMKENVGKGLRGVTWME